MDTAWSKTVLKVRHQLSSAEGKTITQQGMADLLGYSKISIARWEGGVRQPDTGMKIILTLLSEDPRFITVIRRIVQQIKPTN